jgi:hypothetical protein
MPASNRGPGQITGSRAYGSAVDGDDRQVDRDGAARLGMSAAERAVDALLADSHLTAPHELPELIARHAAAFGGEEALIFLADLQQSVLVPLVTAGCACGCRCWMAPSVSACWR